MRRKRISDLILKKKKKEKIVSITAYDYSFAKIINDCDFDFVLIGDSLSNVFAGYDTTLPVTLEDMIYHSRAVRRAIDKAFLVADLPFMSYQVSVEKALFNAGKLMKEALVEAVKLEGGGGISDTVYRLSSAGIPVVCHIGYTPQSEHIIGGPIIQGRSDNSFEKLLDDAKSLEQAGASLLVLELLRADVAAKITQVISIPTIGVGSGRFTDGQCIVINDILGIDKDFKPGFVKNYANLYEIIFRALQGYSNEVRDMSFPGDSHSY